MILPVKPYGVSSIQQTELRRTGFGGAVEFKASSCNLAVIIERMLELTAMMKAEDESE